MKTKKITLILLLVSFFLSVCLGMLDHESTTLIALFKDPSNVVALLLYTLVIAAIGWLIIGTGMLIKKLIGL